MDSNSGNIEIMINDEADEGIKELFKSHQKRYQNNLEKSMKVNEFVLSYVHLLYYKCHKINQNHDVSCMDSPDSIKNKQQ